ncbi:MAG: UvrD-helicase domain-containing protein, partial [Patescibacteria group bacterium]|nr:UvrD-helicase domain-containing protein [Patescibacteria group bacterium]
MEDRSLNLQQKEAVEHTTGPLLIIAGAGTGKTTVITERIKHLILEKHVSPSKILALTFTEKAAQEMEERIDIAMPYGYGELWIETFHAFCDRVLKQEAINIGIAPDYRLTTEAENILFLKKNLFKLHLDYFRPLGNPSKFLQGLLQHFSRLKDEDITPEQYETYAKQLEHASFSGDSEDKESYEEEVKKTVELTDAYKTYEELKVKEGIMDFSDLIAYTLKLFRQRKSIAKKYQDMFDYILIDEFQDTNFAQNQLALILAGKKQNITVVGDDDQAIYRWRGAAISNMIQFRSNFPKSKIVTLKQNYRSTQLILDTAYRLIQHNNPDRLEVKENINKKLTATGKKNNYAIDLILSDRGEHEAETVVKKIQELTRKSSSGKNKYSYGDIAILVRANDHAHSFIKALEIARIPHQFLGPTQLFHQEEIKDIIAYLKILANLEDVPSFYRVLNIPIFDIHPVTISTLLNTAKRRNMSIFDLMSSPDTLALQEYEKENLGHLLQMIRKHLELTSKESTAQIVFAFLQDSGIFQTLIDPKDVPLQQQAQNISKFFDKLKAYESEYNAKTIYETLEWIDLLMQMGESPQAAAIEYMETNAVNILTVHSSKGLEFPVVFIVNLVRDRFPSRQRAEQIPVPQNLIKEVLPEGDYHLEEERRLFYVAVTRAKEKLFFSASSFYGEGKREKKLSPFIAEGVGEELIEKGKQNVKTISAQLSLLDLVPQDPKMPELTVAQNSNYKVTYLSYSQIQTFETCPLHFKLKYILKVPTLQTTAQTFGTSIHAALRDFYQQRIAEKDIKVSDIATILKQVWIHEGYEN